MNSIVVLWRCVEDVVLSHPSIGADGKCTMALI